jgi:hypothetical protein
MSAKLPQVYANIYAFMRAHRITLGRQLPWRLTERQVGEINGLPNSRGILTATNGILCYIEQEREGRVELFLGHLQWFVADGGETGETIASRPAHKPAPQPSKRVRNLIDLYQ